MKKQKKESQNDNRFYTYIYLDPRYPGKYYYQGCHMAFDYKPIYVGKGMGGRMFKHTSVENDLKFYRTLKKLKRSGLKIIKFKIVDKVNEDIAFYLERWFIARIGREDLGKGPLLNLTDGGEGISGYVYTEEQIENKKRAQKIAQNRPETKKKKSIATKKRYEDPKEREKMSKKSREAWASEELRKQQSDTQKKRYEDPKEREKTSKAGLGRIPTVESNEKRSRSQKKRFIENPELRKEYSIIQKKTWTNERKKNASEKRKEMYKDPNEIKKLSDGAKRMWERRRKEAKK